MKTKFEKGVLTVKFGVKNASGNFLPKFDKRMNEEIRKYKPKKIVFDMDGVEKITSAILRRFLRILNYGFDEEIINASKNVVEVLSITNIDKMIHVVHKRPFISTENLKEISRGAYGKVYEYSKDEVLKVYYGFLPDEQILRGVKNSKVAFQRGLSVAIPYATVNTNEGIGVLFEKVKGRALADVIHNHPERVEDKIKRLVELSKEISDAEFKPGELTSVRDIYIDALHSVRKQLPPAYIDAYKLAIESLPDVNRAVHGDLTCVNVLDDGFDLMMVDMDTFSFCHPIWDAASMYTAYYYCYEKGDEEETFLFNRLTCAECKHVWDVFEKEYFKGISKTERKRRIAASANWGLLRTAALYCQNIDEYDKNNQRHVEFLGYAKAILENSVLKNLYSMVEIFNTWKIDE